MESICLYASITLELCQVNWGPAPAALRDARYGYLAPRSLGRVIRRSQVVPLTLGSGSAHFGVRLRSLWGPAPLTLGSGSAHFGVRLRSLWGPAPLTLGSGSSPFGCRLISPWVLSA